MPYDSSNKHFTALNSIKYLTIIITKSLQLSTQIKYITFLITKSLQLSTQSYALQFTQQTPHSSQFNQTHYYSPNKHYSSQPNQTPYNAHEKVLAIVNSINYHTILITWSLQLSVQ